MEYVTRDAPMTPVFVDMSSMTKPRKPTQSGRMTTSGFISTSGPSLMPAATPATGSFWNS